jgi:hypothetical protein
MISELRDLYGKLPINPWLAITGGFILYHAIRAIYLVYLSPLSIFPGSTWAALGE